MKIKITPILNEDGTEKFPNWKVPQRAHANDVGADVYSPIDVIIQPHETVRISLGFAIDVPAGYGAFVFPRSGKSSKGLVTLLPPIDPGYTGSITAITLNTSNKPIEIKAGDAIGQLVITPVVVADFISSLGEERGDNGFGSTESLKKLKQIEERSKRATSTLLLSDLTKG